MPKVLIVDLKPNIGILYKEALDSLGLDLLFIDSFESVPYILSIDHFDAVVIEPAYSKRFFEWVKVDEGIKLVKYIKEKHKNTPVVIHSALERLDDEFTRLGILIDGYAIKSYDGIQLKDELIKLIGIKTKKHRPLSQPSIRIFISYAKEDFTKAYAIYEILKQHKYDPWIDFEHILPGQNWVLAIEKAIENAHFFLALLSSNSISKEGYFQKELKRGIELFDQKPEGAIYLIPVRLDVCNVPDRFKKVHWCNVFEGNGLNSLLKAIEVGSKERNLSIIS